jgi:iron complex outermembrane receptor protein
MHRTLFAGLYLGAICAVLVVASPSVAFADEADVDPAPAAVAAESEASRRGLEEIVVTSRKRAAGEAAQSIPISSTVINAEMIELNQYVDILQVARLVPNSDFRETSTFPGVQRFFLRAVGVSFSVPNFDPGVAVIMDGVYIAQNMASIIDTFDLESIEILRGPQGTLFGRNTVGGAIVVRTKRPGDELLIKANGTLGNYDRADFSFSVEGPIVEERIAARLSVQSRHMNGWLDNNVGTDLGERQAWLVRPTIAFTGENYDLTLLGEYYHLDGHGSNSVSFPQVNPMLASEGIAKRPWGETWSEQVRLPSHSKHENYRITAEYNLDLGHGVVTSITAYGVVDALSGAEFDGLPTLNIAETRLWIDQHQFSQELRYASSFSDVWDFTAGIFYFEQDLTYGEQRAAGRFITPTNIDGVSPPGYNELEHDQWSLFAEAHINLSERLSLTLGSRYTVEAKDAKVGIVNGVDYDGDGVNEASCVSSGRLYHNLKSFSCPFGPKGGFDIDADKTWRNFSPKIGVEYQASEDVLLYASWQQGYRSGGYIFRAPQTDLSNADPGFYEREKVTAYEVGMKSDLLDNRLRLNLAAFYTDWEDIQRQLQFGNDAGDIFQTTKNVEDSHVWGLEAEVQAILGYDMLLDGDNLRVDTSVGWHDSEHDSDYILGGVNLKGQEFGQPDTTLYLGATYRHPLGDGDLSWRASYSYTADYWSEGARQATAINKYRSKDIVDATVRYTAGDGRYHVGLFVKNLTNDEYYEIRVPFGPDFGVAMEGVPRTYGIEVGFTY